MNNSNYNKQKQEYNKNYTKDTYKTIKVYIRKDEYPEIENYIKTNNIKSLSGKMLELLRADMNKRSGGGQLESSQTSDWTDTENHATINLEAKEG